MKKADIFFGFLKLIRFLYFNAIELGRNWRLNNLPE